jgi:hypothetical protein
MNIYAWIVFGAMGFVWLSIAVMFLVCGADWKHKIFGALVCVSFWLLMSGGIYLDASHDADEWNDGYCECGGHWELAGATRTESGQTIKYYSCPNCYAEIEQ